MQLDALCNESRGSTGGFMASGLRAFVKAQPLRFVKKWLSPLEISRYYRRNAVRRLNIGSQGNAPAGWLNADIEPGLRAVYLDAAKMTLLRDRSFDAVLCEHMIEHVPKPTAQRICSEILRILKPNGVARFVTPDLVRLSRVVVDPGTEERAYVAYMRNHFRNEDLTPIDVVNIAFREYGHQYLYTPDEFRAVLEATGFRNVVATQACFESDLFRDAQGHGRLVGDELNDLESFAFECSK